jgi:hypothetical protein
MTYELKKYVDESYDFNSVFPDKVKSVQEITGMNFSLQEIVDFLQVQTSDFTVDNVIAKDLDTAIIRLIEKQEKPAPEKEKSDESSDEVKRILDTIGGLEVLALAGDTEAEDTIEALKVLLPEDVLKQLESQ